MLTASQNDSETNKHIISLYKLKDKRLVKEALNAWYAQPVKQYGRWARKYPVELAPEVFSPVLQAQDNWCSQAKISFTPLIIVNGYQLPKSYVLADLKYLIN